MSNTEADPGHSVEIVFFWLAWECFGVFPEDLEEVGGKNEVSASVLRLLAQCPRPR